MRFLLWLTVKYIFGSIWRWHLRSCEQGLPLFSDSNEKAFGQISILDLCSQLTDWILCIIGMYNVNPLFTSSYFYPTFFCWAASSMGQHSWTLCCFEVWHTRQIGSLSFWQKIFSFSLWRPQYSKFLLVICTWYSSAAILSAKLIGGLSGMQAMWQTGHSRQPFHSQNFCKQTLQTLWPHCRRTGRQ